MISFENVRKFILSDVTVHIPKGVTVGVIGPSGAGKTTLLKLACGLLAREAGRVRTFSVNPVKNKKQLAPKLRAYFSDIPLFQGEDTVLGQFQMLQSLYRQEKGNYWEEYRALAALFSFADDEKTRVKQLSLGQKRRVELASLLMGDAALFLFDEPTNGLDESGREAFWQQLREKKEAGATILISSHNMAEIEALCDRILLLDAGKLLYYGDRENLLKRYAPINCLAVQFQGAIPDMEDLPLQKYRIENDILKLRYNANHISAAEIMQKILEQTTVLSVNTIRPELTDVLIQRKENRGYESDD